jgi:predicted transcriptional regulator
VSNTKDRIEAVKFAAALRRKRLNKGLKASWVAEQMNVTASCLSMLEAGKRSWNDALIEAFQKAVGEK